MPPARSRRRPPTPTAAAITGTAMTEIQLSSRYSPATAQRGIASGLTDTPTPAQASTHTEVTTEMPQGALVRVSITGVYVAATSTKMLAWSRRRSTLRRGGDHVTTWYRPLMANSQTDASP